MNGCRPLIGVTPWYDYDKRITYVKYGYIEGINEAGGMGILLPVTADEDLLQDIVNRFDGFLISGGDDVDPGYYGEHNMPFNGEISPYRDFVEMYIAKKAIECNKPVFGICRGIQVMNAALGGTLYQDIYFQIKDRTLLKHSQNAPRWYPTHEISIERGSRVWNVFGSDTVKVNSYHHQAVKDVADGFAVTAIAPDGIIESIEHRDHIFAVGVQWHPELMWCEDRTFLKLFEQFVKASCVS